MAHFAQLDENNVVIQVIVVANEDILDGEGNESEEVGIAFCRSLLGEDTNWVQTSYNDNFRIKYAGEGDIYDAENNFFHEPQPYPSWTLDTDLGVWVPPVDPPGSNIYGDDGLPTTWYTWNEADQVWDENNA